MEAKEIVEVSVRREDDHTLSSVFRESSVSQEIMSFSVACMYAFGTFSSVRRNRLESWRPGLLSVALVVKIGLFLLK